MGFNSGFKGLTRGAQSLGSREPWTTKFRMLAQLIFVVLGMDLASCYPSGTCDFEVFLRFVEGFCNPDIKPLEDGRRH